MNTWPRAKVGDILKGRCRVTNYEVFVGLADGYGLPRGWLGVAYDQATEEFVRQSKIAEQAAAHRSASTGLVARSRLIALWS